MENHSHRMEAQEQYLNALRQGQKYFKAATGKGEYPYPLVLDEIIDSTASAGYQDLGIVQIPIENIVGTKTRGRITALAGNLMPLLRSDSEFADKWINLCEIHLSDEGIRDPVFCYEYMGKFYIEEGNKRASVLKSFGAPSIPAEVVRIIPKYSDDYDVKMYYEFLWFYQRSCEYGIRFSHLGNYRKLQAALGFADNHIWTEDERKSFRAGFTLFREAFRQIQKEDTQITEADALIEWLQMYPFASIKETSGQELVQQLIRLIPDLSTKYANSPIELNTIQEDREKGILDRIIGIVHSDHINIAFIYAFPPEKSGWTQAQDDGRKYLQSVLDQNVLVRTYLADNRDYDNAIEEAVSCGADLIFATTPAMIGACRRAAIKHPKLKILNCALSQPYTGVRMYYSRLYESKFITGAIAGAMADNDEIGYVCNYPIFGVPASVNAFAIGARMTNPRAKIHVDWSCIPGDPIERLISRGVTVISNRDAGSENQAWKSFEIGTYSVQKDKTFIPLASPVWNWGKLYERIVRSIFSGLWDDNKSRAIHYWWGMDSGVLDIKLYDHLPEGIRTLCGVLKSGIIDHSIDPFYAKLIDQNGITRNDGNTTYSPDEIIKMDWFLDNVEGIIPSYKELIPISRELVRILGLYRNDILPEKEGAQL